MLFKGRVTKIEAKLASFTLENEMIVYLGHYFANLPDSEIKLPRLNTHVTITEGIVSIDKILFAYNLNCVKFCDDRVNQICLNFVKLLRKCELTMMDTIKLFEVLERYRINPRFTENWLSSIDRLDFNHENCVFECLPHAKESLIVKSVFDKTDFYFTTPLDHKIEVGKSLNKIHWNFSVNNFKQNFLIGFLHISKIFGGYMVVTDGQHDLICQFLIDNRLELSEKISKLLNNFVLIHDYKVFSDNIKNSHSLQSLVVDIKNVQVLYPKQKENMEVDQNFQFSIKIKVISRLSVMYNPRDSSKDCLIFCYAKSAQNEYRKCFFRLANENFEKYPLFNPEDKYILHTNITYLSEKLRTGSADKYFSFNNKNIPCYNIPKDAKLILQSSASGAADKNYANVEQVIKKIDENLKYQHDPRELQGVEKMFLKKKPDNELISFEAIIDKKITENDSFRHNKDQVEDIYFGIRGEKIHNIIFKSSPTNFLNTQEKETIIFYKNNLEEAENIYQQNQMTALREREKIKIISLIMRNMKPILRPPLLVPGMKVRIENVSNPANAKYLKTNMFSSFEILEYVPKKEFEATPELLGNHNWGPPENLGDSSHIPYQCLIWGPTSTLNLRALNINIKCKKCHQNYSTLQKMCCENYEKSGKWAPEFQIVIGLQGKDSFGIFDVVTSEMSFFKTIFGLRDTEFKLFLLCFAILKTWECNKIAYEDEELNACPIGKYKKMFGQFLNILFVSYNKQLIHNLDLKCRKMSRFQFEDNREKLYLVESRSSEESDIFQMLY